MTQPYQDHFRGQRVLVTGGAGFIGSHLSEALAGLGADVVVLDDLSGGDRANLDGFETTFVEGSVADAATVRDAADGCRCVFHLAALGSVPRSVEQPALYHEANTLGTFNVLQAAREAGCERVVFSASSSAYGDNPVPWVETMPVLPKSPYAATKVAGEAMLRAWSESYGKDAGLDTCSLRYFNIFGPRQNANSAYAAVIAAFAKALLAGERPTIYGDGEQSRDFTYVANAVHANLLAAASPRPVGGEAINVACGHSVSVNELAAEMAKALGRPDLSPVHEPERTGDIKHSFAALDKGRDLLGYAVQVDYKTGLARTLDWYRTALSS